MGRPNGEMDPWADAIVTAHFRFVQVSAYYDQTTDVPTSRLAELPANAFGDWIAAKQPSIFDLDQAADQVGVTAVGIPSFVTRWRKSRRQGSSAPAPPPAPISSTDPAGPLLLVSQSDGAKATARFWELLTDPNTYRP